MAREYLRITPELTWGAYQPGGAHTIIQLTDSNSFTLRQMPVRWTIRSAGGYNRRVQSGSFKTLIRGALSNLVIYGSQVSAFLTWIEPTLTGSTYDLSSYTIDHMIVMEDAAHTIAGKRYLGVKVGGYQITSNSDASLMRISLTDLIAKSTTSINSTDFTEPLFSAYPNDTPFVHQHASIVLLGSSGGSSRLTTGFDTFQVNVKHMLVPSFFNSTTIAYLTYCGRDADWSLSLPYITKSDRESLFENTGSGLGVVPVVMKVVYTSVTGAVTSTFTLDFQANSLLGSVTDSLDYNRLFMQNITGWSQVDSSSLNDFDLAFTSA